MMQTGSEMSAVARFSLQHTDVIITLILSVQLYLLGNNKISLFLLNFLYSNGGIVTLHT